MTSQYGKISGRQLRVLLILNILGTGIIAIPEISAAQAGNDCWILVLGGTAFALSYVFIINALARMFPYESFAKFSCEIVGKPLGIILSIALALRLVFTAGVELRLFGEIVSRTMLHSTPIYAICGAMLLVCAYLAYKGYETRARLAETLFYIILLPLVIIFATAAIGADYTNVLPLFKTPSESIVEGSYYVSLAFRGVELGLLVYPFLGSPEEARRSQCIAVITTGVILTFLTLVALVNFGEQDLKAQLWPVIRLVDTINLPGKFFERADGFILCFWIGSILFSLSAGIFFSSYIFSEISKKKGQALFILPVAAVALAVCLVPKNAVEAHSWLMYSDLTIGAAYMIFVPAILFLVAKIRGKDGR